MPAERSTKGKAGSTGHLSNHVEPCTLCGKIVSRASDIPRHMKKHDSGAKKLPCSWEGCDFSTLQKSNLDTHYRRHTQDKSFLCTDDPDCKFQTCDPASLLRHRKRIHGYVPRQSNGRKTGKPYKAPAQPRGREASIDSSSSGTSQSSSWESNSLASISPSSSAGALSPYFSPSGDSESTPSTPETHFSLDECLSSRNSSNSPLPRQQSLLFSDDSSPCYYNYAWDASLLPELGFLAAEPEIECQTSYPAQREEPQSKPKDFFLPPLQLPNMEQVFPGYETSAHLNGPHGLEVALNHQPQQIPPAEANNDTWFGFSSNGSTIFQHHNLPAESSQAPVEIQYSAEICSPVRTGNLALDVETGSGLDIRFESGIPWNTDHVPATPSSCDFNSALFNFNLTHPSSKLANLPISTDVTYVQPCQAYSASIFTDSQCHATPYSTNLHASNFGYFDLSQSTNFGGEVNSDFIDLSASGDYFDQCQWDFGFNPVVGIVQATLGGGLQNTFMFSN